MASSSGGDADVTSVDRNNRSAGEPSTETSSSSVSAAPAVARAASDHQDEALHDDDVDDIDAPEDRPDSIISASDGSRSQSSVSVGLSVDPDNDADSALGDIARSNSSISVASDIYRVVEEYGRTFHSYKQGKYFLPNDEQEQQRLELQHAISITLLKGKLYLAPISSPGRVLDIGTGTGIWAVDFADSHPESEVVGTDLSPIQPEYVPVNCRFEIDDAEDEWAFTEPFDFVHARYMVGALGRFRDLFRNIYANMNPGGYVEFQDYVAKMEAVDGTLQGTALERWNNCLLAGVTHLGRDGLNPLSYKGWMREAGFEDVREYRFKVPGNPWAKGEDMKNLGRLQMANILEGIHGMSIGLFTRFLGMSVEEVELLLADTRKDLRNTNIHFYYPVYV